MRNVVNSKSKVTLDWEGVRKGKRSRKAVPRRFTKSTDNISPNRVGDFSSSDSDKLAAALVTGQPKSEQVPIKKRRQLAGTQASSPPSPMSVDDLAPSPTGVDDLARAAYDKENVNEEIENKILTPWDFSGIDLLATTATTLVAACADNKLSKDVEDHLTPDESVAAASELGLKVNESGTSCSTTTTVCANNANSPVLSKCTSLSPCVSSKVDRRFWDLNTDMDAWVEPSDDSNATEEIANPALDLKQKDKLVDAPDGSSCSKETNLDGSLVKPEEISHTSDAVETPNRAIKKDVDESGDADMETSGQVMRTDANLDGVQATIQGDELKKDSLNSYEPQGNMTSLRKTISYIICKREYDDSCNLKPDEVNCLSPVSKSGYFHASGTVAKDEKCVDSTVQSDKTCVTGLMIAEPEKLVAKHENLDLRNEGQERMKLEDSCNSYSTRLHDDRAASVGKVDNTTDPCPDSPYEDGELRESFMYDWEENEETELVDYESDGRKEDSCDGADNIESEIVEGGSEGSHGSEGNGEKSNAVKYPLTSGKKELEGGSGTTDDHSMEMAIDESNDPMRRRYLANRSGLDDCKALMGEYVSRMAREKLQSRTEGVDDKDAFFEPQYRSSHVGGFRVRDVTPEKYVGKYTPVAYRNGRDGVNQWNNNLGSTNRYASNYQGTEGFNSARPRRNFSVDKFDGQNFHDQRQTGDYLSRDMHRPLVRTRSPVGRDNHFIMGKKMPPARRINSYRGSAHYPQNGHYELVPNGPAAPVRFSRMPERERSFSPNSVKDGHLPLNRRRSRSRSRTRSPRAWHSYRETSFGNRRHSGSPDFRPEARMERVKVPFHKPKFTPEYREGRDGYMSPPRGRFPSQRNSRWVGDRSFGDTNDRSFGDNQFKRRRSPTPGFRFNNQANSSGRFKSGDYYRPMIRPKRFSYAENDERKARFKTMYDDEKLGHNGEMQHGYESGGNVNNGEMHRAVQRDYGGSFQRFQRDGNNDFETRNLNNEEGVRAPVLRDVAQVQGVGEDKKETEI